MTFAYGKGNLQKPFDTRGKLFFCFLFLFEVIAARSRGFERKISHPPFSVCCFRFIELGLLVFCLGCLNHRPISIFLCPPTFSFYSKSFYQTLFLAFVTVLLRLLLLLPLLIFIFFFVFFVFFVFFSSQDVPSRYPACRYGGLHCN